MRQTYRLAGIAASQMDRVCGDFVNRHATLSRMRLLLYHHASCAKKPLLVYQMGKVGSTSLVASLRAADVSENYSIYHVHWLSPERLRHDAMLYKTAKARYGRAPGSNGSGLLSLPPNSFHPQYVWLGYALRKRLDHACRAGSPWDVVTLVRDPIARNVSSFFQNVDTLLGYDYRARLRATSKERVVEELRDLFHARCLDSRALASFDADPLTWFDDELRNVLGIDVYDRPFPRQEGAATWSTPRARMLLLRLEDFPRHQALPVKAFLHSEDFVLSSENTAEGKAYSELYVELTRHLCLPAEYVDGVYASRYATHFYTAEERAAFRRKWTGQTR